MSDLPIGAARVTIQDLNQANSSVAVRNLRTDAHNNNKDASKIEKSARDFESILVGQWLEQAEKSFATVPGDDPDKKNQDAGQDQFRSIAFHSLAEGLTKAGGFGIASMITRHLEAAEIKQPRPNESNPTPGKLHKLK